MAPGCGARRGPTVQRGAYEKKSRRSELSYYHIRVCNRLPQRFPMKRSIQLLLILALSSFAALAQAQRPSPTPPPDDGEVVKITTSLIQVDVTVTDSRGRVITDLKPEEVEIYENGKKQQISGFSFISNIRDPASRADKEKRDKNEPVMPSASLKQDQVRRTVALVVDDLTLSFESVYYVRRALRKYVDEQMQEGDLVAIIRTGAGIGALQQFTSDKRMLYAAIERVKWNPGGSGGISAFAPVQGGVDTGDDDDEPGGGLAAEGRDREIDDFRTNYFVAGTLGAINYVVRGMSDLPGRKAVMLFSDGFAMFNTNARGIPEASRIVHSLRSLIDQAHRSSVVIYTLDPRGLQITGLTAADSVGGMTMDQVQRAMNARSARLRDTQDGLIHLARETGGFALVNNNDLVGGIRRVLDDQSYYLVAYEPDQATFDPATRRFNRLDVKVLRKGARVRYRSGFFGISDEKVAARTRGSQGDIVYALTSPFATNEIAVRLNAIFGVQPDKTAFIRSLLHVSAKDITFENAPDGNKVAKFDVLAIGFGDNGIPVDSLSKAYTLTLNQKRYEEFMDRGFVYEIAFPIKKPGGYQLRIALKDSATSRIGSASQYVEVPNLKKKRLTLSGVAVENISREIWTRRQAAGPDAPLDSGSNPLLDTALRQFKRSSIINFGLSVVNARTWADLTSQVRLYYEGKEIFVGDPRPLAADGVNGPAAFLGSIALSDKMDLGEHLLRIDITDNKTKGKYRTATQFLQFEIIE